MLKIGDIIAVKDKSLLSMIIRIFTRSKYSHVGIVYYSCGDYVLVGEINWNYIYSIRKMSYKDYDLYRYIGEIDSAKMQHEIADMCGKKYDFLDIIKIVFCMPIKYTPSRVICSEAIDIVYRKVGCDLMVDTVCPTPEDVVRSKMIRFIK